MKCCVCGKVIEKSNYSRPLCDFICFGKRYWMDIIEEKDWHVIIDGHCYFVAPEGRRGPVGHSGRKFILQNLSTGEVTETTNLWDQGKIPQEFLKDLPDTHIFMKGSIQLSRVEDPSI